ncbi:MAG: hypothetical protein ACUVRJ_09755 [Candidatus Villigracilaceae bacterium]
MIEISVLYFNGLTPVPCGGIVAPNMNLPERTTTTTISTTSPTRCGAAALGQV